MSLSFEQTPTSTLKGVGPALAEKLQKLGLGYFRDLLFHLPLRYEDRTRITPIAQARPGTPVILEGEVIACDVAYGKRRSLLAYIQDGTGRVGLRFYHFSKSQQNTLKNAGKIRVFGEVRRGAAGYEIYHPEYTQDTDAPLADRLTPVYPVTDGLTQPRIRALIGQVLDKLAKGGLLPEVRLPTHQSFPMNLTESLLYIHQPPVSADLYLLSEGRHPAQQRLIFEELVAHQTSLRIVREEMLLQPADPFNPPAVLVRNFLNALTFRLTAAQQRVSAELAADMTRPSPMLRLVQGDVGSGKTVVAAIAAIQAHESHKQAAVMAPTELLAEQHYRNFSSWLEPLGIQVAWLAGRVKGKARQTVLDNISSGEAHIVIGTHALFQDDVTFHDLGLVIIDEQHRFGVHQRLALKEKGQSPHQLVMTATPIPRTLTMSMYADMDCSIIDELPPGRTPVTTSVLPDTRRHDVVTRVREACLKGAQAYWVCTLIEESEVLESQAAEQTAETLKETLPDLRIGLVHGRLKPLEKARVMDAFKAGDIDLLVATTVIEVGVDVPNASLMIIENPERLGLAQLHQLRGRVGRGSAASHCLLLYHAPLGHISKQRLNVMRESNDGFFIAEQDLLIRGPGEVFGSRQSGSLQFRIADLVRDNGLLADVSQTARQLLATDREAAMLLVNRWLNSPQALSQV
ncbi:MAG: ATP-dependent DNA helicase RecG [Pseudomonadales bacterium]|nr:ATP-dependent DNA helicase RecG [Pseudomonadales bacterium]